MYFKTPPSESSQWDIWCQTNCKCVYKSPSLSFWFLFQNPSHAKESRGFPCSRDNVSELQKWKLHLSISLYIRAKVLRTYILWRKRLNFTRRYKSWWYALYTCYMSPTQRHLQLMGAITALVGFAKIRVFTCTACVIVSGGLGDNYLLNNLPNTQAKAHQRKSCAIIKRRKTIDGFL